VDASGVVQRVARSRPSRPKMPRMSSLRGRPVDVAFCSPVVFGDADGRAGVVVSYSPTLRNRGMSITVVPIHDASTYVGSHNDRVELVPQKLGAGADVVTEFAALRVIVHRENVEQMAAIGLQLSEQPGKIVCPAVIVAVREDAPAVQAAILLIVTAGRSSRFQPPFFRSDDQCHSDRSRGFASRSP